MNEKTAESYIVKALLIPLSLFSASLLPFSAAGENPETEVQVNVLGKAGAGKFSKTNITREENKVIQAVFGGVPGDSIETMISGPDGSIIIAGNFGGPGGPALSWPETAPGGSGGTAFVAKISPDMRRMAQLLRLPPAFLTARCLATAPDGSIVVGGEKQGGELNVARLAPGLDKILWTKSVIGDTAVSVAVAPDNSVVVCPDQTPFVSRIAADGQKLIPFGDKEYFRTDAGNPDVLKAWWEGCGYVAGGYAGGVVYHRGECAGVVALKDGTFVLFTSNALHDPGGGPDFDPMLLKFDKDGKILWCTNLLDGLPAESDQKQPHMAVDPYTGDLLLSAVQHGHFSHNLIATKGAFLTPHAWYTGDIMIGWVARVDPATGQPKAATFFFPDMQAPMVGGKRRANSLFPKTPAVDAEGNLYITGGTAWKLETTLHAFQTEPLGGCGFVAAFTPDLSRPSYVSLITSKGYDFDGRAIVVTPGGPAVAARFKPAKTGPFDFVTANAEATNYLIPEPAGNTGSIIGYYPSGPWKD